MYPRTKISPQILSIKKNNRIFAVDILLKSIILYIISALYVNDIFWLKYKQAGVVSRPACCMILER